MPTPRYPSRPGEVSGPSSRVTTKATSNLRQPASFEIVSSDTDRARKFYADMFGWVVSTNPNIGAGGSVGLGSRELPAGGGIDSDNGPGVAVYVRVRDLDAALDRASELGGKALTPRIELPDRCGQVAIFADPDGNAVGLWAAATRRPFTDSAAWI
jgi:uncharacterized protein